MIRNNVYVGNNIDMKRKKLITLSIVLFMIVSMLIFLLMLWDDRVYNFTPYDRVQVEFTDGSAISGVSQISVNNHFDIVTIEYYDAEKEKTERTTYYFNEVDYISVGVLYGQYYATWYIDKWGK